MTDTAIKNHASFIWSVADLLRGDYKQSEYGKVILPLTVLAPPRLRAGADQGEGARQGRATARARSTNIEPVLCSVPAASSFYNTSKLDFRQAAGRPGPARRQPDRLHHRVLVPAPATSSRSSSSTTRSAGSTRPTCCTSSSRSSPTSTCTPTSVSNLEMGYIFEELIRRFSEASNETAGEHFTRAR